MEDPQKEIPHVIHLLTQSPPETQRVAIEKYFTPNASFTHPFCRTGSFEGSRWLIWCIYRWYKIMSPRIELDVDSVGMVISPGTLKDPTPPTPPRPPAISPFDHLRPQCQHIKAYDPQNLLLYVSIHQTFRLFLLPFFRANASLVTVLHLAPTHSGRYLIASQNDLYQVNEFVKFVSLFGILSVLVCGVQLVATGLCVVGAVVGWPVSWLEQIVFGGNAERGVREVVKG